MENIGAILQCPCGKQFTRRALFERHMEFVHSSSPSATYKCNHCNKTFGNENTLTMHMSIHQDKNAFADLVQTDRTGVDRETVYSDKENIDDNAELTAPSHMMDLRQSQGLDLRQKMANTTKDLNNPESFMNSFNNQTPNLSEVCQVVENELFGTGHFGQNGDFVPNGIIKRDANHNKSSPGCSPPPKMCIQIKEEILDDDVTFSGEDASAVIAGFTAEELQLVDKYHQLGCHLTEANGIKREFGPDECEWLAADLEQQGLRKGSRGGVNPLWKSLLTGKTYDDVLETLDDAHKWSKEGENSESTVEESSVEQLELIQQSLDGLKTENCEFFSDDSVAFVPPENFKKAKRSRKNKASPVQTTVECFVCGKVFLSEKYLSMHISLHGTSNMMEGSDEQFDEQSQPSQLSENSQQQPQQQQQQQSQQQQQQQQHLQQPQQQHQSQPTFSPVDPASGGQVSDMEAANSKKGVRKPAGGNGKLGSDGGWSCKLCSKTFAHNSGYKNHMRTHSNERPYVCTICDIGFKEKYHLKKHNLFIHSTELPEKCRVCGKRFKDSTAVRAHERIHSDARPFGCRRCGKTFKTSECLWHHEHRSKTCGVALGPLPDDKPPRKRRKYPKVNPVESTKDVQNSPPLNVHEIKMEPSMEHQQYTTSGHTVSEQQQQQQHHQQQHQQQHHQRQQQEMLSFGGGNMDSVNSIPTFVSNMAPDSPDSESDMAVDPDEVDPEKHITCHLCGRAFLDQMAFQRHEKVHCEDRPFVCLKCNIGFKMKVHLKKHNLYVHSDEYPCECQHCGKRFKDSSAVKLHERTHSNVRPYQCCGCQKAFKTRENLWGHQHRARCFLSADSAEKINGQAMGSGSSPTPSPPQCVQVSAGSNGVTAHASLDSSLFSAHAFVGTGQVTARASIENNQLTAHASFANNHVTAHASLINNQVSAHASVINNDLHASVDEKLKNMTQTNTDFSKFTPPDVSASMPAHSAQNGVHVSVSNMSSPGMPAAATTRPENTPCSPVHAQKPNYSQVSTPAQQTTSQLLTANSSPILTSGSVSLTSQNGLQSVMQWPTLKEFLQHGVEGIQSPLGAVTPQPPIWLSGPHPINQNNNNNTNNNNLSPSKAPSLPVSEYPTIKERLMRGFTGVKPASSAPLSAVSQVTNGNMAKQTLPSFGNTSQSSVFKTNSSGPIPSFQSTFLRKQTPPPPLTSLHSPSAVMRSDEDHNSIPIIYWDDDTDQKTAAQTWHAEHEHMLHDLSESVLTQL